MSVAAPVQPPKPEVVATAKRRLRRSDAPVESKSSRRRPSKAMFLSILPFLILVFLFSYFPLYGWVYSLYDYKPALGLSGSEFVGLQWFRLLIGSPTQLAQIGQVMANTLG